MSCLQETVRGSSVNRKQSEGHVSIEDCQRAVRESFMNRISSQGLPSIEDRQRVFCILKVAEGSFVYCLSIEVHQRVF